MKNIMQSKAIIVCAAVITMGLTSCVPSIYTSTSQTIVAPEGKDDHQFSGSIGMRGVEGQAVFAAHDHVAITAQARVQYGKGYFLGIMDAQEFGINSFGMGLATYGKFKDQKSGWSLLGGFVGGSGYNIDRFSVIEPRAQRIDAGHMRWYIQPALTHRIDNFEAIGSLQFATQRVGKVTGPRGTYMVGNTYRFRTVEPMATFRYHGNRISPFMQAGCTLGGGEQRAETSLKLSSFINLSVGATMKIGKK
jgi:hypothetical protein